MIHFVSSTHYKFTNYVDCINASNVKSNYVLKGESVADFVQNEVLVDS